MEISKQLASISLAVLCQHRTVAFTTRSQFQQQRAALWGSCLQRCKIITKRGLILRGTSSNTLEGLVNTAWLEGQLDEPDIRILDVRGEVGKGQVQSDGSQATEYRGLYGDYVDSHIPGAVFIDWVSDIAHTDKSGIPVQLKPAEEFMVAMENAGVSLDKRIVVYDNGNMLFATRLWWALKLYGHADVTVLDGGWAKWLAEDRPVSADAPCPLRLSTPWEGETGQIIDSSRSSRGFKSAKVDSNFLLTRCKNPSDSSFQLIDARTREQYLGKVSRSKRSGHIPGALNLPYKELLSEEKMAPGTGLPYRTFKSPSRLTEALQRAGVDTQAQQTCCYCNGGVASTAVIFLLNQLYGLETLNYDGSWNEWGRRDDLPIEKDRETEPQ